MIFLVSLLGLVEIYY